VGGTSAAVERATSENGETAKRVRKYVISVVTQAQTEPLRLRWCAKKRGKGER